MEIYLKFLSPLGAFYVMLSYGSEDAETTM